MINILSLEYNNNMNTRNNILQPIARSVNVIHVFTQLNFNSILQFYRVSCFEHCKKDNYTQDKVDTCTYIVC